MKRFGSALVLSTMLAVPLPANDTAITLAAGGIVPVKTTAIVMESEDLRISRESVEIHYRFRNNSHQDIETLVAFPLPGLSGSDLYYSPIDIPSFGGARDQEHPGSREQKLNFLSLRVSSRGSRVPLSSLVRATSNGKDITAWLRQLGLSPNVLDYTGTNGAALTSRQKAALNERGLLGGEGENFPFWNTHISFIWKQRFPAHQIVELTQSYHPFTGGSYWVQNTLAEDFKDACLSTNDVRKLNALPSGDPYKGESVGTWHELKYILTTALNWSGPIRDFHLTITTGSPREVLIGCVPGLKQLTSTRYELQKKDFAPQQNLRLIFIVPDKEKR